MELVLGRYVRGPLIAAGGMGAIHIGFDHERDDALVVLKTLLPELARLPRMMAQFRDEARISQMVRHPNVVEVYGFGEHAGVWTLAMEYVPGVSLAELMKRSEQADRKLPIALAVRIVRDALLGLDGAHRATLDDGRLAEIVHRDVSPQNLMVRKDGVTKVVDFGIARAAVRETKTATGMLKGKLGYMSPEQVEGVPVDARSDQFSMGIVLWELCAGRRLFRGLGDLAMMESILEANAPPLTSVVPEFDSELSACVARLLSRTPDDRFPTCADAAKALSYLADRWTQAQDLNAPLERIGWKEPVFRPPIPDLSSMNDADATLKNEAALQNMIEPDTGPFAPGPLADQTLEHAIELPIDPTEEGLHLDPTVKMPVAPSAPLVAAPFDQPITLVDVPSPVTSATPSLGAVSMTAPMAPAKSRSPMLLLSLGMNGLLAVGLVGIWLSVRNGGPTAPAVVSDGPPSTTTPAGDGEDEALHAREDGDDGDDSDEGPDATEATAGSSGEPGEDEAESDVDATAQPSGRGRRSAREARAAKTRAARAEASMAAATPGSRFASVDEAVLYVRTECQGVVPCAIEASPTAIQRAMANLALPELTAYFNRIAACAEKCQAKRKPAKQSDEASSSSNHEKALRAVEASQSAIIMGQFDSARTHALNALRLDPTLPDPHRILASTFQREENHDRAVFHFRSYLRLGGKSSGLIDRYLAEHGGR